MESRQLSTFYNLIVHTYISIIRYEVPYPPRITNQSNIIKKPQDPVDMLY